VPPEVERFFDAIEAGQWDEIQACWCELANWSGQYAHSTEHREALDPFWAAVLDAYGVAEQARLWPAKELLDYGNSILDSLRPGMVYVGGTDDGRWIPELLNETGDGEPRVVLTQNALADARYLEFLDTLYGDRVATLTSEDSQHAFQQYLADAQRRFEHDQQFPDEPKQLRPGEDIKMVDGRVQACGQTSVMAINEILLQMFMQKNPDLSFALQESYSLPGTYGDALPLGPIMELRAQDGPNTFTAERAAQTLDYWRTTAQQITAGTGMAGSEPALKSYSHNAMAAANLLAAHNYISEAEQAYRLALQILPESPEAIGGLATLLAHNGRASEARRIVEDHGRQYPGQWELMQQMSAAWRVASATSGHP
jgi:hypothetical protein